MKFLLGSDITRLGKDYDTLAQNVFLDSNLGGGVHLSFIKNLALKSASKAGYVISRKSSSRFNPIELSKEECQIVDSVLDNELTMVSRERLIATLMACKYVLENSIEGDFVECGVWRGGNAIVAGSLFLKSKICQDLL